MKLANNIEIRVFCPPEEDCLQIKQAFLDLIGMNEEKIEEEKISHKEQTAKGFQERKIKIFECTLEKDRHCNVFLKRISENLTEEDKDLILNQKNRLDANLNFFLRLEKEELIEGKYRITDSGECFHIKINVAAFPRKKEAAWTVLKEIFQ